MRFFSVIFPTWGCIGVLLKEEKSPMIFIHGTFLLFSVPWHAGTLEDSKGLWGFPPPDWLLCTSQLLNHRRNHQRKRDTKGHGSLNRKRRMCTGDLLLQYKCQTCAKDHTSCGKPVGYEEQPLGEVSGRHSWRSVFFLCMVSAGSYLPFFM